MSEIRWIVEKPWRFALLLMAITFIVYLPALRAGFIWDDDGHVTNNVNLHSWEGLRRIWLEPLASQQYYPLQLTTYWIEYHLWGLRPLGYHLVNVFLHALTGVLLWQVLHRLEIPGAWLAALIFLLHPVGVESVAWISERKNVLSTAFYLSALLAFLRFHPLTGEQTDPAWNWRYYALGTALFLAALLSKTVACSLPVMLLLLIWWKRGRIQALDVWTLGPWLVIGTGLGLVTAWLEKSHNQAGADWSLSLIQRCLLAGRVPWFYAGKLAWPYPLIFVYPRWDIDPHIWWQYLFPIATAGVFFFLWLARRRLGRAPLVAVLIFIVTLFPALGFVDVYPFRYSFVADHFQYLASMSLIALAAAGTTAISQNRVTLMSVVVTVLGALTWQHCLAFHDAETLWRDTLAKNPGCWMAQNNLGLTLVQTGRETEAIEHWMEALRIKPDYAEPHYNLGDALAQAGNTSGAIQQWKQALRFKPDFIEAHQNLGNALRLAGRGTEAVREYGEALRINPKNADTHYNLGLALADQGRSAEAIDQFHLALDVANAQDNIALASIIQVRLKLYETNSLNRQMR